MAPQHLRCTSSIPADAGEQRGKLCPLALQSQGGDVERAIHFVPQWLQTLRGTKGDASSTSASKGHCAASPKGLL